MVEVSGPVALVPELEAFGSLVGAEAEPVSATLDGAARTFQFSGEASVVAPEGAFGSPTVVTANVVDLDFGQFLQDGPGGAVYVVSTEGPVALGTPVFLEIAKPSDSVNVVQLIDGDWQPIAVEPGATTRVPINHFSAVATAVVDVTNPNAAAISAIPQGDSPAQFFRACFFAVFGMFGGGFGEEDDLYEVNLAMSVCTNALIDRLSPDGRYVSTACVGDTIGGEIDIQRAVDLCAGTAEATEADQAADASAPVADAPSEAVVAEGAARYRGEIDSGFNESSIDVVITSEGVVSGTLHIVEDLENYIASVDFGCGLFDEEEDCSGAVVECPATVEWRSDMSTLTFIGDAPDNGTLSGDITITYFTTPLGCGEPASDTDSLPIEAIVTPEGADITVPLSFSVPRVELED